MAAGALLVVVAGIVVVVLITSSTGPARGAGRSSAPAGSATVKRRTLVATDTESGTLSYANPATVYGRVSGTITWLPAVGQVIGSGQTLYRVDGSPVVLMNGSTPAWRALSAADSDGPDILALNRDLRALGFDPSDQIVLDDAWQSATTSAVERWQASVGQGQTGTIGLGQVVFLPGSQRVTGLDAALGSTGGGGGGSSGSSGAGSAQGASTAAPARPELVSLRKPVPPSRTSTAQLQALIALLRAETAQLRAARSSSSAPKASSGAARSASSGAAKPASSTAPAEAIMQTSSTQLVVTVDLDASKQSEAVVGRSVSVQLPDGSTVGGRISAVSPVAQTSASSSSGSGAGAGGGGSGSSPTVPVTIALKRHLSGAGLDQAAVSVSFEQQTATNVLSVPVTALLATQGGGYAVQEAQAPHRLIPVTPGLFGAGFVQVSGSGVYPGLDVTDSQG